MKILKIFGLVVGIHVFALVLIFANPGCSSSSKPAPMPADTASAAPPGISDSTTPPASTGAYATPPVTFNPDAPAVAASPEVRFTPTRPGTPAAGTLVAEPVVDVTPATTYTVKSGDSLWTIAKRNHLTVAQLAAANSLPTNTILRPGQKLLLPGQPAAPSAAATANPAAAQGKTAETVAARPPASAKKTNGTFKHTVKPGETLGVIARQYGVKSGDIAVANNIVDPAKINAGAELIIPGWDTAGSKSRKAGKSGGAKSASKSASIPPSASTPPPSTPPTIDVEGAPSQPTSAPPPPVIRIDEDPNPIVPAPKEP